MLFSSFLPSSASIIVLTTGAIVVAAASDSGSGPTRSSGWSTWPYLPDLLGLHSPSRFEPGFESLPLLATNGSTLPWSQPPLCLSIPEMEEPLCLFTSKTFGRGRGISIVTAPSQASQLLEMAAFRSSVPPEVNRPHHKSILKESILPHAGRGMVATTHLQVGETLYAYTPVLLLHPALKSLNRSSADALRWEAVRALPPNTQRAFWDLAVTEFGARDAVEDRIAVNAFAQTLDGIQYALVSPEVARLNHECRPNAIHSFDQNTMTQYTHVIRAVLPGEQLTLTYVDILQSTATRQSHLSHWGFKCDCSACRQHPALTDESDSRVVEIRWLSIRSILPNGRSTWQSDSSCSWNKSAPMQLLPRH
jgi:SET domain